MGQREKTAKSLPRNATTTNRHAAKKSTTFCVFPLDTLRTQADTAHPDSGDRGNAGGIESSSFVRSTRDPRRPARVLTKKTDAFVSAPLPQRGAGAAGRPREACVTGRGQRVGSLRWLSPGGPCCAESSCACYGRPARQRGETQESKIEGCPGAVGNPEARRGGWLQ
jgi:hypothetical protein